MVSLDVRSFSGFFCSFQLKTKKEKTGPIRYQQILGRTACSIVLILLYSNYSCLVNYSCINSPQRCERLLYHVVIPYSSRLCSDAGYVTQEQKWLFVLSQFEQLGPTQIKMFWRTVSANYFHVMCSGSQLLCQRRTLMLTLGPKTPNPEELFCVSEQFTVEEMKCHLGLWYP